MRREILWSVAAVIGWTAPAPAAAPDWAALRHSVVDLEVYYPGMDTPERAYGFGVAGVEGILASHRQTRGAQRVIARRADGTSTEISRYIAHDPDADLILLDASRPGPGLVRGTHHLLSKGQVALAVLPPSVTSKDVHSVRFVNVFAADGVGDLLALWGNISTGVPLADSLGRVVGLLESIENADSRVTCAVPITRIDVLLSRPDPGGRLLDLAEEGPAPWTTSYLPEGLQVMGAVLCRVRKFERGLPLLERALAAHPDSPATRLELGMAYQSQNEFAAAESLYQQVLEDLPGSSRAQLYLGSCYFSQGLYSRARQAYEAAVASAPDWGLALVNLGGVLYQLGDEEAAEQRFREAIDLDPEMGLARYNLGMILQISGRHEELRRQIGFLADRRSGYATMLLHR